MHIGELEPGVVLLLPCTQRIPGYKRWNCGEGKMRVDEERRTVTGVLSPQSNSFLIVTENYLKEALP